MSYCHSTRKYAQERNNGKNLFWGLLKGTLITSQMLYLHGFMISLLNSQKSQLHIMSHWRVGLQKISYVGMPLAPFTSNHQRGETFKISELR